MGELREPWHTKQVELLDRHLHLLHLYSQAKENLSAFKGTFDAVYWLSCKNLLILWKIPRDIDEVENFRILKNHTAVYY